MFEYPPSDEETPFDVFVSYARADASNGWLEAMVSQIRALSPSPGAAPLRVFFDTNEIEGLDKWRNRIEGAIRRSKVFLACLSPRWCDSYYCRWEWESWQSARSGRRAGTPSGLAVVWLQEFADDLPPDLQAFALRVQHEADSIQTLLDARRNGATSSDDWCDGPAFWATSAGGHEAQRLVAAIGLHISRERQAARSQGNLPGAPPHFVGRHSEIEELHRAVALTRAGLVSVLQGLGGIGKSALALQYAYEHAWHYPAGLWHLPSAGHRQLLPLIASLAYDSHFLLLHGRDGKPLQFTAEEQRDQSAQGRAILLALLRRAHGLHESEQSLLRQGEAQASQSEGNAVLLILDNVDSEDLLSASQLSALPALNQGREVLRLLATSRLGVDQFDPAVARVLKLEHLSDHDSYDLVRAHRRGQAWPDADYELAVRHLLKQAGGYTLVVEQIAAYLSHNPTVRPEALLQRLTTDGLGFGDRLLESDARMRGRLLHSEKMLEPVLGQVLESLDPLPLARVALEHAAWLPPDYIAWEWLKELALDALPAAFAHEPWEPDPWSVACDRLTSMQLLVESKPGVAKLHRAIGDHTRNLVRRQGKSVVELRIDASVRYLVGVLENVERHIPLDLQGLRVALRETASWWQQLRRNDELSAMLAGAISATERVDGSIALAVEYARWAVQCCESAASASPGPSRILALSLNRLASCLVLRWNRGDEEEALSCLNRSLQIRQELQQLSPHSRQADRDVAVAQECLADFLAHRSLPGDVEQAIEYLELRLLAAERAYAAPVRSVTATRDLAVLLMKLTTLRHARGLQVEESLWATRLTRCITLWNSLLEAIPDSVDILRSLAAAHHLFGLHAASEVGDSHCESAQLHLEKCVALSEALRQSSPDSVQAARDLATGLQALGSFMSTRDDPESKRVGLEHQRRSLQLIREMVGNTHPSTYQELELLFLALMHNCKCAQAAAVFPEADALRAEASGLLEAWERKGESIGPLRAKLKDYQR